MKPEQQPQAHAKRCEDTMQERDEALRVLHGQICKIEKMALIMASATPEAYATGSSL